MKATDSSGLHSTSGWASGLSAAPSRLNELSDGELREFLVEMDRAANVANAHAAAAMAEMARSATGLIGQKNAPVIEL